MGIAIGGIAVLVVLSLVFICCRKKRRRDDRPMDFYGPPPPLRGPKGENFFVLVLDLVSLDVKVENPVLFLFFLFLI